MDTHTIPTMITCMKEQLFGRTPYYRENAPCFITSINFSFSDYGYHRKDGNKQLYQEMNARRSLAFVFTGNTTVWAMEVKDQAFFYPHLDIRSDGEYANLDQLKFQSDHDSSWRESVRSVFSTACHEMVEHVTQHRQKAEKIRLADYVPFLWDMRIATGVLTSEREGEYGEKIIKLKVDEVLQIRKAQ